MDYPKRLIEVDLPIARISAHSRREKSIRHGHISTLHIWWARRPLAACRAVICASLWADPADTLCPPAFREAAVEQLMAFARRVLPEKITEEGRQLQSEKHCSAESRARWEGLLEAEKQGHPLDPADPDHQHVLRGALLDFIADFANWDNSTVPAYLETSRALTQAAHEALGGTPGTRPLVVDPFAGGGSIPLEALRVGADAFASDLNPVAVLLNKVVLEYIPKYGQRLADEVRKWGQWVKEQAEEELSEFYPQDSDGATPIAYLWARTILSEAPGEDSIPVEVPLLRSMWLCKKENRKCALRWVRDKLGAIKSNVVDATFADGSVCKVRRPRLELFQPQNEKEVEPGTVARSSAICPVTGYTTPASNVRKQFGGRRGGADDARMVAVVTIAAQEKGRNYRLPNERDTNAVNLAVTTLVEMGQQSPLSPISPNEELPYLRSIFNVNLLGINEWGDLFSRRQILSLAILSRLIRQAAKMVSLESDADFERALTVCLALAVDRQADLLSSVCRWLPIEAIGNTFGRQALGIVWDFAEAVPISGASGSWKGAYNWIVRVIEHEARSENIVGEATKGNAAEHALPDDSVNLFVTDPPYYDAVPYADLSDFFYVWLKRNVAEHYPDLFTEELTPKKGEIVQLAERNVKYRYKTKEYFENLMTQALAEGRRECRHDGLGIIVFAHKTTTAWETMLQSVLDSGWTIVASWPIDTERAVRLRAIDSAALASSVHLVCRPRENPDGSLREAVGEWRDILAELPKRIHVWMPRLAAEGVVGADAIFACLGPALEVFSRYSRVDKASGEEATLREYLEHVWAAVSTEALSMIFKDADAASLEPDGRLTAMWLWTLGAGSANGDGESETAGDEKTTTSSSYTLEFDAARKIAQGLGVHLEQSESIVEVKGDKARLLPVSERTHHLFGKDGDAPATGGRRKKKPKQKTLFEELDEAEAAEAGWGDVQGPSLGETVLDRVHQTMILFAAGRSEAMKRFLVEDGAGTDARFWKLAQSLSALYPSGTDEKRWVDGVLARKKGLGF